MDLTEGAIIKLEELTKEANSTEEVHGRIFSTRKFEPIIFDPRPETINVFSLTAIVDYINENHDGYEKKDLLIHVKDPGLVIVYDKVSGELRKRTRVIAASTDNEEYFPFGAWMGQEEFIIKASALFFDTDHKAHILKAAGCMIAEASLKGTDDGATMAYTSHNGVVTPDVDEVLHVVTLKPFRTFRQVEQPESSFIFRYRAEGNEIKVALFEADGGTWKHVAMANIKAFFKEELPDVSVLA